jgi:Domain of unknown function (DUF1508)
VAYQQGRIRQISVPPQGGNGEIIATSQAYERKGNAEKGIGAVKASADAEVVDLTEEAAKK